MDALIYTAMSGADRVLRAQQVHANSLANLDTPGYLAQVEQSHARAVPGYGYAARHLNQLSSDALSERSASQRETGRELDVAIQGPGLFAVQTAQGEAYTRAGNFTLDAQGRLLLGHRPVLGDQGPITLPPHEQLQISSQGVISVQQRGEAGLAEVAQLKLVNADLGRMTKNEQGLLVARDGVQPAVDGTVRVAAGKLEGSNVSAVEELVATMSLARDFELQMKLFKSADSLAESGNRLIRD